MFFLTAIIEQARSNADKAKAVLDLYREKTEWIANATHSQYAVQALDWFFARPIFKTADYVSSIAVPEPTAKRIVRLAKNLGLLRELCPGSGRRSAILAYPELLNIAEGRTVF